MASEVLLSVGIDIGTSTTQLIFSKLTLKNMASDYAVPRIEIVDRKIVYKSHIYFTPLKSLTEIDGGALAKIIENEYGLAGIKPENVKTGAVIITGETARKENAQMIVQHFSEFAGDFVVATAGPDLESILAGRGAGADKLSKKLGHTVLNIDIGGGTSNLALFKNGEPIQSGCMDIGGRLIKFDEARRIVYISEKLKILIQRHALNIREAMQAPENEIRKLTDILSGILEMSAGLTEKNDDYELMVTNHGLTGDIEAVSFSGGVAEYIYDGKTGGADSESYIAEDSSNFGAADFYKYGDIGLFLAQSIRRSKFMPLLVAGHEKIRATVVGAGSHTTKLSGSTITVDTKCLPLKNIPVIKLNTAEEFDSQGTVNGRGISEAVLRKLQWFGGETAAIAVSGLRAPSFLQVQAYAKALTDSFFKTEAHQRGPLIVISENDMAKVLGQTLGVLRQGMDSIICLDGIELSSGDYIDIGNAAGEGYVVPVVVKTLVFHE